MENQNINRKKIIYIPWTKRIIDTGNYMLRAIKENYPERSFTSVHHKSNDEIHGKKIIYTIKEGRGLLGKLFGKKLVKIIDHTGTLTVPTIEVFEDKLDNLVDKTTKELEISDALIIYTRASKH